MSVLRLRLSSLASSRNAALASADIAKMAFSLLERTRESAVQDSGFKGCEAKVRRIGRVPARAALRDVIEHARHRDIDDQELVLRQLQRFVRPSASSYELSLITHDRIPGSWRCRVAFAVVCQPRRAAIVFPAPHSLGLIMTGFCWL